MSDAPVWRTLAELGWDPPAVEPAPELIRWELPAIAGRWYRITLSSKETHDE